MQSLGRIAAVLAALGCVQCVTAPAPNSAAVLHGAEARPEEKRLPSRLRRLSNAEYRATLTALLGLAVELPGSFPEDVRVDGFSSNARQGVDPTYLAEAQALARSLAARAASERLGDIVPCDAAAPGCARRWLSSWGERAYRRALAPREIDAAVALFERGAAEGGFQAGVELVLGTLLVSPELLYVNELGTAVSSELAMLRSEDAASVLAYMFTGGPPDEPLLRAGIEGRLGSPAERAEQAWRLLGRSETRFQFRRFVREWLGLDPLESLTKPVADDRQLRLGLLAETDAFVDEVFMYEGASLDRLLLAEFTVIPASLRAFEGLPAARAGETYGRVSLAGSARLGLLQQPSFLAVHSHEQETAPVLRGKAILERLLCVELPRPSELGLVVNFPLPDPRLTTRERHARHTEDVTCRSCHRTIDALGNTFENFDFVGRQRQTENQRAVDTRTDYDGPAGPQSFKDSRDVSRWLAASPRAHECFARQAFRFFTGQTDPGVESAFLRVRDQLPDDKRGDLFENLVAFAASPLFMERSLEEQVQ
jgi:hypothetical protein